MRNRGIVAALACGTLALVAWLALGDSRSKGSLAVGAPGLVPSESATKEKLGAPDADADALEDTAATRRAVAGDFVASVARGGDAPPPGPRVVGRVVDELGEPIEGADVFFARADRWVYADLDVALGSDDSPTRYRRTQLTTDGDGRFELLDPERGRLRYLVRAAEFAPSKDDNVSAPTSGVLDLGDIELEPALVLEGRVVDPDGHGVADAEIARATTADDFGFRMHYAPVTRTNDDGIFRIDTLAPGEWEIRVDSAQHPIARFAGATFEAGVSAGHVFQLERGWTITGWLAAPDATDCSKLFVSARPVGGLEAADALQWERITSTADCDTDGRFEFCRLFASDATTTYALSVWPQIVDGMSYQVGQTVEALVGTTDVRIPIDAPATLRFGLRSGDEPLTDATVYIGWTDVTANGQLVSETAGRFRVVGIQAQPRGVHRDLRIRVDGFREYSRFDLPLALGDELDLGVLELQPATALDLVVVDHGTEAPIEGVSILRHSPDIPLPKDVVADPRIVHWDGRFGEATTDVEGRARVSLAAGYSNALTFKHADYAPLRIDYGADVTQLRVELSAGATVRVRTEDADGAPVPRMQVSRVSAWESLDDPLLDRSLRPRSREQTDVDGIVLFERLPPGTTTFTAHSPSAQLGERTIDLIDGDDVELVFVVPARADLEVLVRESGLPLVDAELGLRATDERDDQGQLVPIGQQWSRVKARTNGHGIALLESAPVGEYVLAVSHATRALEETLLVQVAADSERVVIDLSVPAVEGVVRSVDGSACANAYVYALDAEMSPAEIALDVMLTLNSGESYPGVVRTSADGRFELRGLPVDTSLVVVAVPEDGVAVVSDPLALGVDEKRSVTLPRALRAGSVRVSIEPEDRALQRIDFESLDPHAELFHAFQVWTNYRANPHIGGLPPGPWRACAVEGFGVGAERNRGPWTTFDVAEGETTTIVLTLPK